MSDDPPPPNTVRLWMAASQAELGLVANSHWSAAFAYRAAMVGCVR